MVFAFALFASAWRDPFHLLIGLPGDNRQFAWFMSWGSFAFLRGHNPLLSNYVDWPAGANMMWNTSLLLPAAVLAPVTALLGPIFSSNLLATLAPALSAWSGFLLIKRFVGAPLPSLTGGLIYGFSPFIVAQSLGHPMLTLAVLPPLIFLVLDDIVRRGRRPIASGAALGTLAAAQLLISEEVLAATALTAVVVLILAAAYFHERARQILARLITAGVSAVLAFLLFAGYPLLVQFFGPLRLNGALHPPNLFVNNLFAFVVPTANQWLSLPTHISELILGTRRIELGAYLGIPLLLLLAYAVLRFWSDVRVRIATLTAVVLAIWSLGVTLHVAGHTSRLPVVLLVLIFPVFHRFVPWRLLLVVTALGWLALTYAPVLRQLLPSRLSLYIFLFGGFLTAVLLREALTVGPRQRAVFAGALVIALISLFPRVPYTVTETSVPEYFSDGVQEVVPGSVVLIAPFSGFRNSVPMLWQAVAQMRFRMPEGYAFTPGPDVDQLSPPPSATRDLLWAIEAGRHPGSLSDGERSGLQADLAHWQVRDVIVGPMPHQADAVGAFSLLFGRSPEMVGGVALWTVR